MLNSSICDATFCAWIPTELSAHPMPVPSKKADTIRLPARIQKLQLHSCVRPLKTRTLAQKHLAMRIRKTRKMHHGPRLVTHIFVVAQTGAFLWLIHVPSGSWQDKSCIQGSFPGIFGLFTANPGAILDKLMQKGQRHHFIELCSKKIESLTGFMSASCSSASQKPSDSTGFLFGCG